ncbi:hypothetical protein EPA93_47665 [Ktedonosporobacter rubrisoli]|uniref:N,N-dimethylformamidase beta subunit-like C-terminal domain-containing protein n=1 Tax=Ktedonosporobacter rubrisoli TaxID=2509675 RepID=A0A4P6K4J1_KTERU|nr:N,N-dimethylformamidase beta subunit family domain-containing protein [Ktedonosporobacter rubrisoli]QBD83238.1 hypothetical protein EPA93_47665 [Ktedonosporobacter rubrisoli]
MLLSIENLTRENWPERLSVGANPYSGMQWLRRKRCVPGYAPFPQIYTAAWVKYSLFGILFLVLCLAQVLLAIEGQVPARTALNVQAANPIYRENQHTGTTRWQSVELLRASEQQKLSAQFIGSEGAAKGIDDGPAISTTASGPQAISGYAAQTSINHGDALALYISTKEASYNLEVYRMGWYKGNGARLLLSVPDLSGQNQPIPSPQPDTGLIECNWQVSYVLQTSQDWVSGIYLVKLIAKDGSVGYITFVLRADEAAADILYQVPVATYQAYNHWGGKSLYDFNSTGGRAYKVSYDRPYYDWAGAGFLFTGDYNMLRWLEAHNYNVTYVTSLDTQTNPLMYTNRKVFLTDWHDEYWSKDMRDNLALALSQGENLAFFAANDIFWQIRFEPSSSGVSNRIQVCYKDANRDPLSRTNPDIATVMWRDAPVHKPENALLGIMYNSEFDYGVSFPWVVTNSQHWIYKGTGLKNGSTIPGLVGYEFDSVWNNGLTPSGLVPLSRSPVISKYGEHATASGAIYTAQSGALVFVAGTIYWPWKLDDNTYEKYGADRRVQMMTTNVLSAMRSAPTNIGSPESNQGGIPAIVALLYANKLNLAVTLAGSLLLIALGARFLLTIMRKRRLDKQRVRLDDDDEFEI